MNEIKEEISEERQREAWRLRMDGWTQQEIADHLGLHQSTVWYHLKQIRQKLAAAFRAEVEELRGEQTEQLIKVYRTSLEQWRRSCEDAQRETVQTGRAKASEMGGTIHLPDLVTTVTEGQSGNPALLATAMKALGDIRDIWGMDAPKKVENKHSFDDYTDDEIEAYIASEDEAESPGGAGHPEAA